MLKCISISLLHYCFYTPPRIVFLTKCMHACIDCIKLQHLVLVYVRYLGTIVIESKVCLLEHFENGIGNIENNGLLWINI